jgi:VWFA-related protein
LTPTERQELTGLDEEGRQAWIDRFLADPTPETDANELVIGLERRGRLARAETLSPADARYQLLFLNGPPLERTPVDCGVAFVPAEIWAYELPAGEDGGEADRQELVVFRPGPGRVWRLWVPLDGKRALYTSEMAYWLEQWEQANARRYGIRRFDLQVCKVAARVDQATGVRALRDFQQDRPSQEDYERFLKAPADRGLWARRAAATEVPDPRPLTVQEVQVGFPERQGQRIVTRALLRLPPEAGFTVDEREEPPQIRLTAHGIVELDGEVFDEFRLRFQIEPEGGAPVALAIDRALRPGKTFVLRVTVEDEVSGARTHLTRSLQVPWEPDASGAVTIAGGGTVSVGEEVARQRIQGADSLLLVPPETEVVIGLWRAEALVTGNRIQRVIFSVDDVPQFTRTSPPWTAELRLAQFPTEQVIKAEGYDAQGQVVAKDEVVLNQPRGTFRVRILAPERGQRVSGATRARAEVTVPEERKVERVEFRVGDQLVKTLEAPPWEAAVTVPEGEEVTYLAVSAFLDDGTRAEDVRFLNSPEYLEEVEVSLVELYTAVTDRDNRPVTGLAAADFTVLEDRRPQTITKFEQVENLPLTLGLAIDTSGSMVTAIGEARRTANDFVAAVLKHGDRAFAVAFASKAVLLIPPTDDVGAISEVIEDLQAVGFTALHDAIVTSLYYFRAVRGQKALILLSDGDDTSSSIKYEAAVEYARRSGVAIYAIGLGDAKRNKLATLAEETGGRVFVISKAEELAGVYGEIERELRSRYLIAYAPDNPTREGTFREVQVEVKKRGLKARTIRGYYP